MNKICLPRIIKLEMGDISMSPLWNKKINEIAQILENEYNDFGKIKRFGNDMKKFEDKGYLFFIFSNNIEVRIYE